MKKLRFGVKNRFLEIPVFLRILWSGVVGAIHTFVTEHVANKAETSNFAHEIILKLEGHILVIIEEKINLVALKLFC